MAVASPFRITRSYWSVLSESFPWREPLRYSREACYYSAKGHTTRETIEGGLGCAGLKRRWKRIAKDEENEGGRVRNTHFSIREIVKPAPYWTFDGLCDIWVGGLWLAFCGVTPFNVLGRTRSLFLDQCLTCVVSIQTRLVLRWRTSRAMSKILITYQYVSVLYQPGRSGEHGKTTCCGSWLLWCQNIDGRETRDFAIFCGESSKVLFMSRQKGYGGYCKTKSADTGLSRQHSELILEDVR